MPALLLNIQDPKGAAGLSQTHAKIRCDGGHRHSADGHRPCPPMQSLAHVATTATKGTAGVLSDLIALCPPPGSAVRVDWARAEGLLGLALPEDYKALVETYGVGWFSEWLMADLPDSPYPQFDLLRELRHTTAWHRSSRDHRPGTISYAFHPEPSGLIRWGHTRTAEELWWLPITDDPASWRIVVSSSDGEQWKWTESDSTTTGFIYMLLTGQLRLPPGLVPILTERPLPTAPQFMPMPVPPDTDWDHEPHGLPWLPAPVAGRDGWQTVIRAAAADHPQRAAPALAEPITHQVPADYLELLADHGPGSYAGLAVAAVAELPALGGRVADRQRSLRSGEHFIPAHFHPEPGGLIPWGELPGGDACCWYPAARDPATWPVVVCSAAGAGWQRYDLTTTAFLCQWLAGRVDPAYQTAAQAPLPVRLARLMELLDVSHCGMAVDWPAVEARLGAGLPTDYRGFVECFGAGSVNQELYIDVPFAPWSGFDLIAGHAEWARSLRQLHEKFPEYEPYPPYPSPGGLLLWGQTNSRVSLSWHTADPDPNAWPVVFDNEVDWVDCGRGLLDILLDHLTGRDPLPGLIEFSPAWPPRWQAMRHREMLSPTTEP
jgi:hypothetical protein